MKVEFQPRKQLSEIGGNYLEYSLLVPAANNTIFKGCHVPFVCKDFLTDIFWGMDRNKYVNIFGFSFSPSANHKLFDRESYYLGIRLRTKDDMDKHISLGDKESCLADFLNQIEDKMGIPCSSVNIDETGDILVIDFFPNWIAQPHLISLFTLLIRVGIDFTEGNAEDFLYNYKLNNNNFNYISQAKEAIKYVIGGGKIHRTFSDFATITTIHNSSGIVACAQIDFSNEEILFVLDKGSKKMSTAKKNIFESLELEDATDNAIEAPMAVPGTEEPKKGYYAPKPKKWATIDYGAVVEAANKKAKIPYVYQDGKIVKTVG